MTSPATKALELQHHQTTISEEARQGSINSKLSFKFFSLNFDDNVNNNINAFPVIEWDSTPEDYSDSLSDDSSCSVRSMDSWNPVLTDFDSGNDSDSSLGKRGRCNPKTSSQRLVRSKKINSDLSSLSRSISSRFA